MRRVYWLLFLLVVFLSSDAVIATTTIPGRTKITFIGWTSDLKYGYSIRNQEDNSPDYKLVYNFGEIKFKQFKQDWFIKREINETEAKEYLKGKDFKKVPLTKVKISDQNKNLNVDQFEDSEGKNIFYLQYKNEFVWNLSRARSYLFYSIYHSANKAKPQVIGRGLWEGDAFDVELVNAYISPDKNYIAVIISGIEPGNWFLDKFEIFDIKDKRQLEIGS